MIPYINRIIVPTLIHSAQLELVGLYCDLFHIPIQHNITLQRPVFQLPG